jgi:hypothetical protein
VISLTDPELWFQSNFIKGEYSYLEMIIMFYLKNWTGCLNLIDVLLALSLKEFSLITINSKYKEKEFIK